MRQDAVTHCYPALRLGPMRILWIAPRRLSAVSIQGSWREGEHSVHGAIGPLYVELRLPRTKSKTVTR